MKIRNTYKRITAAVLSAVLLLSLAACNESEKKPDTETNKPSVTTKSQDTKPAAQSDTTEQQKTPSEPEKVSPVYTDWSKLTPYEPVEEMYTYHAGYCGSGTLQARDDYGVLLPYVGKEFQDCWYDDDKISFGLVTKKGELVTDSVYADIVCSADFLVLRQGHNNGEKYINDVTIAARDGHWLHELIDAQYVNFGYGLLATSSNDESLDIWDTEGNVIMHFDGSLFKEKCGENFFWRETWRGDDGAGINWNDNKVGYIYYFGVEGDYWLYLDFETGEVMNEPPEGYPDEWWSSDTEDTPEPPNVDGYNHIRSIIDDVSGEVYFYGYTENKDQICSLFDRDGNMLVEKIHLWRTNIRAGLYSDIEGDCFCYRTLADHKLVFRYLMQSNTD